MGTHALSVDDLALVIAGAVPRHVIMLPSETRIVARRVLEVLAETAPDHTRKLEERIAVLRKHLAGIAQSEDCGWKVYTGMAAVALEDDDRASHRVTEETP